MTSATPSPWRDPFRQLKLLVANKRWGQLRDWLDGAHLWVYDRPMTSEELVEALAAVLDNSADPSIDIVAQVSRGFRENSWTTTFTCCLVWGEPDSWVEHEVEFDLHLGTERVNDTWKLLYLGVTPATPEEFAP